MEKHTVSRLVGSPPGYVGYEEGGQLTEAVRRKPFSVVLFDEVEKAHPDVFNTLLQILEDGRLTDAQGRAVDFKNTVLIMTSNLGTADLRKAQIGFAKADEAVSYERMKQKVGEALKQHFRPEFLNRIDDTIVFHELSRVEVTQIVDLMMKRVRTQLEGQGLGLELTDGARMLLAEKGYDPTLGARPLRRAIQRSVEDPLSERILWKEFRAGVTIIVDAEDEEIVFRSVEGFEPPPVELAEAGPATDAAHRIGSLLINPGGPGASGVEFARQARTYIGAALRSRFDVVGFDPRGVGQSEGVKCEDDAAMDALFQLDFAPGNDAER